MVSRRGHQFPVRKNKPCKKHVLKQLYELYELHESRAFYELLALFLQKIFKKLQ